MSDLERFVAQDVGKDNRWNLQAVWDGEKRRIEAFIDRQANLAYGKKRDTEQAKQFAGDVWTRISQTFPYDPEIDPALIDDAKHGRLQEAAGSATMITTFGLLRFVAMGVEVAVFVAMWLFGESSPVVVSHGIVLAVSAFALGWGLGEFFIGLDRNEPANAHPRWRTFLAMLFGVIGVAVIIAIRVRYQQEGGAFAVIAITLVVALVIVLFEALYRSLNHNYERNHHAMFRAQVQFANERHNSHHMSEGQTWKKTFEDRVEWITNKSTINMKPVDE